MKRHLRFALAHLFTGMITVTALAQTTLTAVDGAATLDGVLSAGEWTGQPIVTAAGVTLYAMGDGEYLYLAAQWTDATATESINKNMWTYDGTTWTKSGNEDRFGIIWDMGLNGPDGAACTTMCHGTTMGTSAGIVDVWHWKAARGGTTMGVIDDKWWDTAGRHSDPGMSAYSDNALDAGGNPSFMQTGGASVSATFLAANQAVLDVITPVASHPSALATAFDTAAGWTSGDTVPGYVLRVAEGDRGNVTAMGNYLDGVWTVEFKKLYAGGDYDFAIEGSSINFTHDTFDNTGGAHPFDGSFDLSVYTLDISGILGPVHVAAADSLALVALYNSTNGPNWTDHTNWLTGPVNSWHGVTIDENRVTVLDLSSNGLSGPIPTVIGNLTNLEALDLAYNQLTDEIPFELGEMTNIAFLSLRNNQLTGDIPVELGNLTNLITLTLAVNQLTGPIPVEIGYLTNLRSLWLANNQLTGAIPAWLGSVTSLQSLYLGNNQLTGEIPVELSSLM